LTWQQHEQARWFLPTTKLSKIYLGLRPNLAALSSVRGCFYGNGGSNNIVVIFFSVDFSVNNS